MAHIRTETWQEEWPQIEGLGYDTITFTKQCALIEQCHIDQISGVTPEQIQRLYIVVGEVKNQLKEKFQIRFNNAREKYLKEIAKYKNQSWFVKACKRLLSSPPFDRSVYFESDVKVVDKVIPDSLWFVKKLANPQTLLMKEIKYDSYRSLIEMASELKHEQFNFESYKKRLMLDFNSAVENYYD